MLLAHSSSGFGRRGLSADKSIYWENVKNSDPVALCHGGMRIHAPDVGTADLDKGVLKGIEHPFQLMNLKDLVVLDPEVFHCKRPTDGFCCPRRTDEGVCCGGKLISNGELSPIAGAAVPSAPVARLHCPGQVLPALWLLLSLMQVGVSPGKSLE